ncbi:Protein tiptop [Halotydeus destructor]|nr:Protein tiptop [Halotydeus destructor]
MSRRKQSNPKPLKLGEEADAGGESTALNEVSALNEDDGHRDGDERQLASASSSSCLPVKGDEEEEDEGEEEQRQHRRVHEGDQEEEQNGHVGPLSRLTLTPLVTGTSAKGSSKAKDTVDKRDKKGPVGGGGGGEGEALDFSAKAKVKRRRLSEASEDANSADVRDEKRPKGNSDATSCTGSASASTTTFPLDLSVKRPSSHSSSSSSVSPSTCPRRFQGTSSTKSNISSSNILSPPPPVKSWSPSALGRPTGPPAANGGDKAGKAAKSSLSSSSSLVSGHPSSSSSSATSRGSHGRQNPWQTQWINRSSEQTRDVFTCVWCKESFKSLQDMTMHMKESPRCGMAGMQQAAATVSSVSSSSLAAMPGSVASSSLPGQTSGSPSGHHHHHQHRNGGGSSATSSASSTTGDRTAGKEPMSSAVLAKNSVNLPRKLVRGQDVWLGRGAEQTRQILKCMWCGQSFKTLDDMTRHMRVTQHYTNIISQEQIISWRTPEDKLAQAQVNAVLTCKVCDEAFGSLKELSYHMVKNAHYKEHILRSITEGGHGRRRQTRERRKKSLPVRKLLELERMTEVNGEPVVTNLGDQLTKDIAASRADKGHHKEGAADRVLASVKVPIPCDDCGERVAAKDVISHLKSCKGNKPPTQLWSPGSSTGSRPGSGPSSRSHTESPPSTSKDRPEDDVYDDDEEEDDDELDSDGTEERMTPSKSPAPVRNHNSSIGSLSALESLIEKSFDVKNAKSCSSTSAHRANNLHLSPGDGDSINLEPSVTGGHRYSPSSRHSPPEGGREQATEPVRAVLTCKVCDETFCSLNELSYHMRKNAHYKVHILRSVNDKNNSKDSSAVNNNNTPEPVDRKAGSENNANAKEAREGGRGGKRDHRGKSLTASEKALAAVSVAIACHECGDKIEANMFMKHLKACKGSGPAEPASGQPVREDVRSPASSVSSRPGSEPPQHRDSPQLAVKKERSPVGRDSPSVKCRKSSKGGGKPKAEVDTTEPETNGSEKEPQESGSGLGFINAIESLIERSFGAKSTKKNPTTGILQRLGIDEEACPPWQHMASQAFMAAGGGAANMPFHPFHPWVSAAQERRSTSPSASTSSEFAEENGSPS